MPFRSEKQRRFLWAAHPDIAKRWAHEYPQQKNLPTYARKKQQTPEKQAPGDTKEATMSQNVTNASRDSRNTAVQYIAALTAKYANSAAVPVKVPHSEKPVAAGEEHVALKGPDQEGQLLGQVGDNKPVNNGGDTTNPVLHKLAVVLSQQIQQRIADEQAAAQGQESQPVPANVNMKQYAQPASATPLPMGMAQAQSQQMQAAMPQAQPQQAPAPAQKAATIQPIKPMYSANHPLMQARKQTHAKKPRHAQLAPVGNGNSPNASPINSYSGLSATGDLNGNAAFGTPNSAEKQSGWANLFGKFITGGSRSAAAGATTAAAKAAPKLSLETASGAVAPALASARGVALPNNANLVGGVFNRAGNLPLPRPPHLRVMAAKSDAGGLRRFGDSIGRMPADQKARMSSAWNRWYQAAQARATAAGTPMRPQSNPFAADDAWSALLPTKSSASSPAWQRSEGKNEEGGLNEKGRKSYEREHGGNLKAPVTEKNPTGKAKKRRHSFCSRMCGMKRVNTGASTAKDPDSRINKSLRKWNCKCSSAMQFGAYIGQRMN